MAFVPVHLTVIPFQSFGIGNIHTLAGIFAGTNGTICVSVKHKTFIVIKAVIDHQVSAIFSRTFDTDNTLAWINGGAKAILVVMVPLLSRGSVAFIQPNAASIGWISMAQVKAMARDLLTTECQESA